MISTFSFLRQLEKELQRVTPSISKLEQNWEGFWRNMQNGVLNGPGSYTLLFYAIEFRVDRNDVQNLRNLTGLHVSCKALRDAYNRKLAQTKIGQCAEFMCTNRGSLGPELILPVVQIDPIFD